MDLNLKMRYGSEKNQVFKGELKKEKDSSSEDDENAELLTEDLEKGFFKVLGHLKKKDPKIYEENVEFYSLNEQNGNETRKKKKKKRSDKNYKKWLKGQKINEDDSELKKDLGALHDVWTDPNLSKDEQFLRDYILNEKFLECDESFDVEKELDKLSEEEQELQQQLIFEEKYNCRFEKADKEFLKKYPHSVGKSVEKKRKSDSDSQTKKVKKIKKENMKIDKNVEPNTSKCNRKSTNKVEQFIENKIQLINTKIKIKEEPDENEMQGENGEAVAKIRIKSEPLENEWQWENVEEITKIKSEPDENEMQGENEEEMNHKNKLIEYPHSLEKKYIKKKRKKNKNAQIKVKKNKEEVESDREDESKIRKQNGKSASFQKEGRNTKSNKKPKPQKRKPSQKNGETSKQENILNLNQHISEKLLEKRRKNRAKRKRFRERKAEAKMKQNGHPNQHQEQREKMVKKKENTKLKVEPKKECVSGELVKNNSRVTKHTKKKDNKREKYLTMHGELINKDLNTLIKKEGFSLKKMIPQKKLRHRVLQVLFPKEYQKMNLERTRQKSGVKKKNKTLNVIKTEEIRVKKEIKVEN